MDGRPSPRWQALAVATGGALGSLLRAAQAGLLPADAAGAVFIMNVAGSLSIGALAGLLEGRAADRPLLRPFLGIGVYGGYTTFAGFELAALLELDPARRIFYIAASVALGLLAAHAGLRLGRRGPRAAALALTLAPALALLATLPAARRVPAPEPLLALAVALGGGAGALARAGLAALGARASLAFPWGTLAANVLGSFLAGALAPPGAWRALVVTGFLGGLTTFSTFSLEALRLGQEPEGRGPALYYVVANVALGLVAAWAGLVVAGRG